VLLILVCVSFLYSGTPAEDPFDPISRIPNELQAEYYEQRASAGLVITEATTISEEGYAWRNAPQIATDAQVEGWKKVVDRVHAKGGKIYLQLWHMGRCTHSGWHPTTNRIVAPSSIALQNTKVKTIEMTEAEGEVPHAMTLEDIKSTVQDFVEAAKRCQKAGFDGVEIHGANGYLVDEFLQSCSNIRTDEYGGSKENRIRFLTDIIEGIIESGAYPANRIAVRISPNGSFSDIGSDDNFETFTYVAKELNKYGLAYLHVLDGLGFGLHGMCAPVKAADIRKVYDGIIMCNVGLTKEIAEGMIRTGATDMAAFGRLYISNPDLPERFANNWPVADPAPYNTWWTPTGASGYTDFPTYEASETN
jgi:2,4-dienoyl-CoA reductase-like NADH-dependent reductase (Old Yellow Enzyme family)